LHAIDEPVAHAATRIHTFPVVGAGQHIDGIEATRCSLRRREALLLADCWQLGNQPGFADPVDASRIDSG
jgi:hypothetical protein